MVVLKPQSEFGHAPPPQTPYSIVTNLGTWDTLQGVIDRDVSLMTKIVHTYPRLVPLHFAATLCQAVANKVGSKEKVCLIYLNPIMWQYTSKFVTREQRGEYIITPDSLDFKVVDVAGHRLYAVLFEKRHIKSVLTSWSVPGMGISIRGAEQLLKSVDTMIEIPSDVKYVRDLPKPTWTPEGPAHDALRSRIVELLHHGSIDPATVQCQAQDVFLFPSGMAAVFNAVNLVQDYRSGTAVELGVLFFNCHELLDEENSGGLKHFGKVDKKVLDSMEAWLIEEHTAGRQASFVMIEFTGNPALTTVDLKRLKQLSEKYGFVLVVDDTVSGFSNVDVLAYADILQTSLTKSFSGRANVMGGSLVLNPLSPHYSELSVKLAHSHHNELFVEDAETLLTNSQDYYSRMNRFNKNAQAMAEFLHKSMDQAGSPITAVQYPSLLPCKPEFDAFMRQPTPEMPEPGYGCLLNVDFENLVTAKAFYDSCGFYSSPHLGGHVTIMLAYNMIFTKEEAVGLQMRKFGLNLESVRISAGLENEQDLIDTLQHALDAAIEEKKKGSEK